VKRIDPFFLWIAGFVVCMVVAAVLLFDSGKDAPKPDPNRVEPPKKIRAASQLEVPAPIPKEDLANETSSKLLKDSESVSEVVSKAVLKSNSRIPVIAKSDSVEKSSPVSVDPEAPRVTVLPDWELPPTKQWAGEAELMRRKAYLKVNPPAWKEFQTWLKQDLPHLYDELVTKFYEWDLLPQKESSEAKRSWILGNQRIHEKMESLTSSNPEELPLLINDLLEWFDWQRYQPRFEVLNNEELKKEQEILEKFHTSSVEIQRVQDFYQAYYKLVERVQERGLQEKYYLHALKDEETRFDRFNVSSRSRRIMAKFRAEEIYRNKELKELFLLQSTPEEVRQNLESFLENHNQVLYWDLQAKKPQWEALDEESQNQKWKEWAEENMQGIAGSPVDDLDALTQIRARDESLLTEFLKW